MAKEFFKNLPDTSTPLTAERLNGLLDGEESMGSIIVENIKCKNMINKNTFTLSYTYGSDGVWTFNDKNAISDYIEIENNKPYTISSITSPTAIVVHYFNSSKQWQERAIYQNVNEIHITNTSDYPYIRISFNYDDTTTVTQSIIDSMQFQVEEGEVVTKYVEHEDYGYTNSDLIKKLFNIPSERLRSTDNIDNFYNELGVKVYSIWDGLPIGMPSGVYAYGTLISITQSTSSMFLNTQIYIPDGIHNATSSSSGNRGLYIRTGTQNWLRITGTTVSKTTN